MISEDDKTRIEDAMECNNCLCWHKYCNSECCRIIFLDIDPEILDTPGEYIKVKRALNYDEKLYYTLRDVKYVHGFLLFKKDRCIVKDGRVLYITKCSLLAGNLCSAHPHRKPNICKKLTEETASSKKGFDLTENCLFRYKEMIKNATQED